MGTNKVKQEMDTIELPAALTERSRAGIRQAAAESRMAKEQTGVKQQAESQSVQRETDARRAGNERQVKPRRRRLLTVASLAGALVLAAVLIQQPQVWAALARALQFVPGIGIVQEESANLYVLEEPVRLSVGEGSLTITGGMSDDRETYFTIYGQKTRVPDQLVLTNEQGDSYELTSSTTIKGGDTWSSDYWYKGPVETKGQVRLMIPLDQPIEVDVDLAPADSVASYEDLGPTKIHQGLSITAAHQRIGNQLRVTLLTPSGAQYIIDNYGIHGFYGGDPVLQVTNSEGKQVEITRDMGVTGPAREFYIPLTGGEDPYELTLPEVLIEYPLESVKIKVPTETHEQLNREVELAGFPVTLTRTERVEDRLRIYVDVHYNPEAPVSLLQLGLRGESHMARFDETTGAFLYLEFDAPAGKGEVTLHLESPVAVVRGPWVFELQP